MTERPFRIRSVDALDLVELARIHHDAFGWEAWNQKAISEILAMKGAGGLLAIDARPGDPRPLGFALYLLVAGDAELLTLAVLPGLRRRGIGTALVEDFMARALAAGATQALLEVAEDNVPAQGLYRRLGFRSEGMRPGYYRRPGNRRIGAHLLRRVLPRPQPRRDS